MVTETSIRLLEKVKALEAQVGRTPLVRLKTMERKKDVELWAKVEWKQLSGSVKCRAAYAIFRDAIERGHLGEGQSLLDATSGNTGIAYASIGQVLGIGVTLCLPENASKERKAILQALGAQIIYTSRFEGTDGAQEEARALAAKHPQQYFYADQYRNDNNWKAHYHTTAPEIIEALPNLTHFVTGLGTTGSFTGTAKRLKEYDPSIKVISFQPDNPLHGLEGWKHMETAIVPQIYDPSIADANLEVSTEKAYAILKEVAQKEGLILSPSSAANIAGALLVAEGMDSGKIVTLLPDNGDKYSEVIQKVVA